MPHRNAPMMPQNAKCQKKEKKQLFLPNNKKKISPINRYILISKTKTRKKAVSLFRCFLRRAEAKPNTHRQMIIYHRIYI